MANITSTAYLKHLPECEPDRPERIMRDILLHPFFNRGMQQVRVGRHPANEVVLESERIPLLLGRFHCYIELDLQPNQDYVYILGDKRTTNGCYVGSELLPPGGRKVITHGTILGFGGPQNVSRDGRTQRNPFRFVFMLSAAEELPPPRPTRSMQELQQAMMCAVCHETMVDAHILPCGHSYCGACIWTWSERRLTCPECRTSFRTPTENTLLEDFHELTLAQSLTPEEAVERKKRKAECVQERTRMKRNRGQTEAQTRRNVLRQPGAASLPRGLIEGVLMGAYAISVTGGPSDRPERPADVLRRGGTIRVVPNPYRQPRQPPQPGGHRISDHRDPSDHAPQRPPRPTPTTTMAP
ncbi:hypothetical protein CYMTET_38647 [Cymbomonas tetramitiformis]|uniref:E3 ubiquitin-protein ligase CHFR n=1 Tax=Cymbomonas tetramitiformis TaxID=36881 RepID=A0AAE0CD90_9CHLO|nr:hypothetical protein CYMTET_38647 [Cymbomonas tetramitiformis]